MWQKVKKSVSILPEREEKIILEILNFSQSFIFIFFFYFKLFKIWTYVNLQQAPKPEAHFPEIVPLLLEHSSDVMHVPKKDDYVTEKLNITGSRKLFHRESSNDP